MYSMRVRVDMRVGDVETVAKGARKGKNKASGKGKGKGKDKRQGERNASHK